MTQKQSTTVSQFLSDYVWLKPRAVLWLMCALLLVFGSLCSAPFRASGPSGPTPNKTPLSAERPETGSGSLFRHLFSSLVRPAVTAAECGHEGKPDLEEDTDGRSDWFTFQRTYPGHSTPPDARLKAWRSRPEYQDYQLNSLVVPEATQSWHAIGPSPTVSAWFDAWGVTSGRVNAVAVSPANSSLVVIGSSTGGIWRTTDRGNSFAPVSDDQVDLAVGSLAFSQSDPSIVFAGMGDTSGGYLGSGVLKSTDQGATWARVSNASLPSPGTIARLEIDPTSAKRLYVAQYSKVSGNKLVSSGVYLSTDGGTNWSRVLAGAARDVSIDPSNTRTLYAGLSQIDKVGDIPFGAYKSTDAGATWSTLFTATQFDLTKRRDIRISVSPLNSNAVYAYFGGFIGDTAAAHLRSSSDGGATWSERSLAGVDIAQLGYDTYLIADPRNALTLYIGSRDLFKSTNGGDSWDNATRNFYDSGFGFQYAPGGSATHTDQHAFAFSPGNPNEIYLGNDGGVSKSTDGGLTFRSLNSTLTLTQFISIALHPTNSAISYGGTQDNGTQQRSPGNTYWSEILSGDGGHCVIDPLDPSIVCTTYVRGDVFRLSNDGRVFEAQIGFAGTFGESTDNPRIAFYPPFVGNGVDASLYFGTWRLFISADVGNSWTLPSGLDLTRGITDAGRDVLSTIGVARSNKNVIYTGSAQGRAMVSTNGGGRWTDITAGLPDRSITSITVDPADAATAYLTLSGFGSGHVFKTTNTGGNWVDVSGSLPDVPANTSLVDPGDGNTIFLGTDIGVFRSTAGGADWRSFNRGMPPVVVHEFSANRSGVIQVATYGRGAFELGAGARPSITAVTYNGKKLITIDGSGFGDAPSVIVNGDDRSAHIVSISDTSIQLMGKVKKLGLVSGTNTIQVVTPDNGSSNVFTITVTL